MPQFWFIRMRIKNITIKTIKQYTSYWAYPIFDGLFTTVYSIPHVTGNRINCFHGCLFLTISSRKYVRILCRVQRFFINLCRQGLQLYSLIYPGPARLFVVSIAVFHTASCGYQVLIGQQLCAPFDTNVQH